MCCTAGLPMHMAMTMLLARARPDRLLIEPSGLGHPKEVMSILTNEHYKETLSVGATLTLVDARKVSDSRYTEHETFNEQLEMGDVIVATKADLYQDSDFAALQSYLADNDLLNGRTLVQSIDGSISLSLLNEPFAPKFVGNHEELGAASDELPEQEEAWYSHPRDSSEAATRVMAMPRTGGCSRAILFLMNQPLERLSPSVMLNG